MPRYFFDIDNGVLVRDSGGQDLPDQNAAQAEAYRLASEYASDPGHLRDSGAIVVTVRDPLRDVVLRVRLVCQLERH